MVGHRGLVPRNAAYHAHNGDVAREYPADRICEGIFQISVQHRCILTYSKFLSSVGAFWLVPVKTTRSASDAMIPHAIFVSESTTHCCLLSSTLVQRVPGDGHWMGLRLQVC